MVARLDDRFKVCGDGKVVERDYRDNIISTPQSPITLSRSLDVAGVFTAGIGYIAGDMVLMQFGMALYQANTGNRA